MLIPLFRTNNPYPCWRRLLRVPWISRSVNPKGNQSWIFTGRTDVEAEAPIFHPPAVKSQLNGKDSVAGKDWRQKENGRAAEDEMVRRHHRLKGQEFEQTLGDSGGQRILVSCSPWSCKTKLEWLNDSTTKTFLPAMAGIGLPGFKWSWVNRPVTLSSSNTGNLSSSTRSWGHKKFCWLASLSEIR